MAGWLTGATDRLTDTPHRLPSPIYSYYSSNATWVLGDDALNPRDEGMSKGEHTWFDRISCLDWQNSPPPAPPAAAAAAANGTQPQMQPPAATANASQPLTTPLPPPAANATQPKQQGGQQQGQPQPQQQRPGAGKR